MSSPRNHRIHGPLAVNVGSCRDTNTLLGFSFISGKVCASVWCFLRVFLPIVFSQLFSDYCWERNSIYNNRMFFGPDFFLRSSLGQSFFHNPPWKASPPHCVRQTPLFRPQLFVVSVCIARKGGDKKIEHCLPKLGDVWHRRTASWAVSL